MLSLSTLKKLTISILVVAILGYFIFQARYLILGPQLIVFEPQNGITLASSTVVIKGNAKNINFISLDDRPIFVDERGNFQEIISIFDGYNVVKIYLKDKFGRQKTKTLELIYHEPKSAKTVLENVASTTPPPIASTTVSN